MTPKERVTATINFKEPDKVPIALYEVLIGAKMVGKKFSEVFLNGKLLAKSRSLVYEEFGQDIIDIETGIATEASACGCLVEYPEDSLPWIKSPAISSLQDIARLKIPDPFKCRAMCANLEAVNIISEKFGDEVFIIGEADQGPFSLAGELRGMTDFYMDLAFEENDKKIHELLNYTTQVVLRYARELSMAGADAVCIGESPAGPSLISPEQYMKFAQPYEKKVIKILNSEGILVANHICGCIDKILDSYIDTGANMIEIDERTNLKLAKDIARNKTTILGAVAPTTLTFNGRKEIEKEVYENMKTCMPDYGYVLSPGCVIGANTPVENIKSFIHFGRKYGVYPI